jgi:phosphoglycerate dehydrogenase-like enzyme
VIVSATQEILPSHQEKIVKETGESIQIYSSIDQIPQSIADETEILITFGNNLTSGDHVPVDIARFPKLKWIQMLSAGIEDLPLKEVQNRGICVTNASGIHITPMSEYVLLCMLHFEKDMERYRDLKKEKRFDRTKLVGELIEREVLIYGTGTIGQAVARMLTLFNVKVFGVNTIGRTVDPFLETFTLEQAAQKLRTADYVISLLPSTTQTRNFFSREYVNQMKKEAVFISMGRGDVVDEESIVEMIKERKLKGAAFDVFKQEPLPADSPLWECENLILTPHMSAKSIYYIDRCVDIFIENLTALRTGRPMINVVDISREY